MRGFDTYFSKENVQPTFDPPTREDLMNRAPRIPRDPVGKREEFDYSGRSISKSAKGIAKMAENILTSFSDGLSASSEKKPVSEEDENSSVPSNPSKTKKPTDTMATLSATFSMSSEDLLKKTFSLFKNSSSNSVRKPPAGLELEEASLDGASDMESRDDSEFPRALSSESEDSSDSAAAVQPEETRVKVIPANYAITPSSSASDPLSTRSSSSSWDGSTQREKSLFDTGGSREDIEIDSEDDGSYDDVDFDATTPATAMYQIGSCNFDAGILSFEDDMTEWSDSLPKFSSRGAKRASHGSEAASHNENYMEFDSRAKFEGEEGQDETFVEFFTSLFSCGQLCRTQRPADV